MYRDRPHPQVGYFPLRLTVSFLCHPLLQPLAHGSPHLRREFCAEFVQVRGLTYRGDPCHRLAHRQAALTFGEHFSELVLVELPILILEHDELLIEARSVALLQLLLGGITEDQHADRKNVLRQVEHFLMSLVLFHDVADVTGTDAERLRRNDCILRRDQRVTTGQEQVASSGFCIAKFLRLQSSSAPEAWK